MSGMYDGIVEGGEFYPFACSTCGGEGLRACYCDSPTGNHQTDCGDCIGGRNPALEWIELCNRHLATRDEESRDQLFCVSILSWSKNPCEFRWVAIGVAE